MTQFHSRRELLAFILLTRWPHRLFIVVLAVVASIAGLTVPFFQKSFVESLQFYDLSLATVFTFVSLTCFQLTNYWGNREALICQSNLANRLYAHILSLKSSSTTKTVGEKVALYTTDIPSSTMLLEQSLPYFLTTVFPLILAPIFLKVYYELPFVFSLPVIGVLVIFNMIMAHRQSFFFYRFKLLAGERMGLVNEWVQNIKSLKILNWIPAFEKKIIQKRKEETHNRILMVTNGQIMNSFSANITFWLNLFVLIFVLIVTVDKIQKSDLMIIMWVMGIFLSRPLRQLPWLLTMMFDAITSVNRLYDFLKLMNKESVILTRQRKKTDSILEIENLNLVHNEHCLLKNINLTIRKNEIIGLIGPVGSGKSLLLKSILDEATVTADHLFSEPCSYLPQEPFILSATIKDNISLSYDSNESEYTCLQALQRAEFDLEQDRLPLGTATIVGERGLNLSGGQKQRLNLARIFFDAKNLVLLDDPFSSVDIGTEQKLIQSINQLKAEGRSFLVTTQRCSFLEQCDRVIFLENGQIEFNGTLTEFKAIDKFQRFLT